MGKSQSVVVPYESPLFENESKLKAMRLVLRNEYTQELFSDYIHNTTKMEYLHYFEELQSIKELTSFFIHKQQEIVDLIHRCLETISDVSNNKKRIDNTTHSNLSLCFAPLYDMENIPDITYRTVVSALRETEDNILCHLYTEFDGFIHSKAFQKIEKSITNTPSRRVSMDIGKGSIRTLGTSVATDLTKVTNQSIY